MIDTDKYEGHQVSEFKTSIAGWNHSWVTHRHTAGAKDAMFVNHATAALITDAPLLLEELKRLREAIDETADLIELVAHTEHQRAIVSRLRKVIE